MTSNWRLTLALTSMLVVNSKHQINFHFWHVFDVLLSLRGRSFSAWLWVSSLFPFTDFIVEGFAVSCIQCQQSSLLWEPKAQHCNPVSLGLQPHHNHSLQFQRSDWGKQASAASHHSRSVYTVSQTVRFAGFHRRLNLKNWWIRRLFWPGTFPPSMDWSTSLMGLSELHLFQ